MKSDIIAIIIYIYIYIIINASTNHPNIIDVYRIEFYTIKRRPCMHALCSPQDEQSWVVLQAAARVRQFEPILNLKLDSTGIPTLHYHRKCRAEFTHKKSLASLSKKETSTAEESTSKPR